MVDLTKYPRVKKYLQEHPEMNFNQLYEWAEKAEKKLNESWSCTENEHKR